MKRIALLFTLLMSVIVHSNGQSFGVVGQATAGGGAWSGGRFQINGTVGQPAVSSRLSGGCISIDSGVWARLAVISTPGAPTLRVRQFDRNYVRVSFTPGCGKWVLQWTRRLDTEPSAMVWTDDSPDNLIAAGEELVRDFHVPSWGQFLVFRLRQQE